MPRAAASYFFPHPQQPLAVHVQELPPPHLHPDLPIAKHTKKGTQGRHNNALVTTYGTRPDDGIVAWADFECREILN